VVFDAATLALPELGFMVENQVVQQALWRKLTSHPDVTLLCPATLHGMTRAVSGWQLTLDTGQQLQIKLLAGVDGAHSRVRKLAGIGTAGWQYRQACLLITVQTSLPPQDLTWQKFFPSGPRAFLPLFERFASLAWYDSAARVRQLQAMPLSQLNKEIAMAFPQRLGPVQALAAGSFPLFRHHAYHYIQPGLILSGDAAHSIHPLAGQGVNLGYRDVAILLDVLNAARSEAQDWNSEAVLLRYQRSRRMDNLIMQSAMDFFHVAFSHPLPAVKIIRNLALTGVQRSAWLKRYVLQHALGLTN
jgi:2-octaprenyl-3-methyl-6-methoxy-1,4-benzoquinol hydroxylase